MGHPLPEVLQRGSKETRRVGYEPPENPALSIWHLALSPFGLLWLQQYPEMAKGSMPSAKCSISAR